MIPMLQDVKAGFFLVVVLAMLLFICAIATLGAVLQPVRWSDRKATR
jgi:Tfp pilus assembly protein PilX